MAGANPVAIGVLVRPAARGATALVPAGRVSEEIAVSGICAARSFTS